MTSKKKIGYWKAREILTQQFADSDYDPADRHSPGDAVCEFLVDAGSSGNLNAKGYRSREGERFVITATKWANLQLFVELNTSEDGDDDEYFLAPASPKNDPMNKNGTSENVKFS